jgi:hypothetical protein
MAGESTTVMDATPVVSEYTQALAKRVIRKIDMRVLLIMFVTYNLNFMDKTVSTTYVRRFTFSITASSKHMLLHNCFFWYCISRIF